jgi:hypothetical protein
MRRIRVTVGTVGYYDAKHAHKRMTAADGPFKCEDTQAERFVSAGVAEYVGGVIEADKVDEQEVTGHLAKSQLEEMTIQQLQNLAGDLGVDVTGCKKKADYVDAIAAAEVTAGGVVDDEDADGDELPDLNAADPE